MLHNGYTNGHTLEKDIEAIGDMHIGTSTDTPLREDAFLLTDDEKMQIISKHFKVIMETLGLDLTDDSLSGTPDRVAKMYVKEIFQGLNPANKPKVSLFDNKYAYNQMLIEKNISFHSHCEHHFVPIEGICSVAYISSGKVIGLSKINRIVQYYARRPQVQERLTEQIAQELKKALQTEDVALVMDAKHMCVSTRGVQDHSSSTITAHYSGKFLNEEVKAEFLKHIYQSA